jgi:hypothetical protein
MIQRIYAMFTVLAIMAVAVASLSGCGSTGSGVTSQAQSQAAKADVTISAQFPTAGGAVKSLIPAGAQVIEVFAYQVDTQNQMDTQNPPTLIASLTPAAPAKTVKMAPGGYYIYATAYDSADTNTRVVLGQTSTGGEVKIGVVNNVNLTFLDGQWTIVDANDTPTPLVLSDGTQLIDMIVGGGGGSQPMYKAVKSAIDYTKPIGGGGGSVRLRFNNNSSAWTEGWMASQFVGASNSNILGSGEYNLTKKCGFDNYYGLPCNESVGDQIVMISSKHDGYYDGGGYDQGPILYGYTESLLPNGGDDSFTQNGQPLDIEAALPDTTVTGGNLITGGIIEWKSSTERVLALGTPAAAKTSRSQAVKAQSANTTYANLTVKSYEPIVCSNTNPQNRGTWSFANNSSASKVVLGSRVCYTGSPNLNYNYNPATNQTVTDAGDYSYGFVPVDTNNLGDYCHQWNYDSQSPNYNTCLQQLPGTGDVYQPSRFRAVKTDTKTSISYGSFKFNFWGETSETGTAYLYPFRAKGSTTVTPAK